MGLSLYDEQIIYTRGVQFLLADGTTPKDLAMAPQGWERIHEIWATNTDAIAHVVQVMYQSGALNGLVGSVSVPAGAGVGGAASVALLATIFGTANEGLAFNPNTGVVAGLEVAMVGTAAVTLLAIAGGI